MKRRKKVSQSTRVTKIDEREPEEKESKTDERTFNQTFSVVQEYVGHGVGRQFHQPPTIPHDPTSSPEARRQRLEPGVCFTIEPMINTGTRDTLLSKRDGWTVRTKDGGLSAQFEHTILMTESGPEPMTVPPNGPKKGHKF